MFIALKMCMDRRKVGKLAAVTSENFTDLSVRPETNLRDELNATLSFDR